MIYIIFGIIGLGIIIFFLLRKKDKPADEKYFISTQGQSEQRVNDLDLDEASEDASYILNLSKLSFPKIKKETENIDYKADPEREWILDLVQVSGEPFKKSDLLNMLDYDWRKNFSSTIYGFSNEDHLWTFAFAGDSPETYQKIQIAIDLNEVFNEEHPGYAPEKLGIYITELEKRIKKYPTKLKIAETESIPNAIIKAKKLVELNREFDQEAMIVLKSKNGFRGLYAWDALQSVGLKWGDGDLFHWNNAEDYGHDQHFSVWTTTEPTYFFPEDIKEGTMNPDDLVFGFSIPRSADPEHIFEIMIETVKYCQKRLGGIILDKDGHPFNEAKEKKYITGFIEKMKMKGLVPGSDKALQLF